MSWHCPACRTIIRSHALEDHPRLGERYRCHVCRLELQLDMQSEKLTITPFDPDLAAHPRDVYRARTLPIPAATRRKV